MRWRGISPSGLARYAFALRWLLASEYAAIDLITLNAFKQGFEITLAKATLIVALALGKFKEDGAELWLGKDLQEEARFTAFGGAIQQNTACLT